MDPLQYHDDPNISLRYYYMYYNEIILPQKYFLCLYAFMYRALAMYAKRELANANIIEQRGEFLITNPDLLERLKDSVVNDEFIPLTQDSDVYRLPQEFLSVRPNEEVKDTELEWYVSVLHGLVEKGYAAVLESLMNPFSAMGRVFMYERYEVSYDVFNSIAKTGGFETESEFLEFVNTLKESSPKEDAALNTLTTMILTAGFTDVLMSWGLGGTVFGFDGFASLLAMGVAKYGMPGVVRKVRNYLGYYTYEEDKEELQLGRVLLEL